MRWRTMKTSKNTSWKVWMMACPTWCQMSSMLASRRWWIGHWCLRASATRWKTRRGSIIPLSSRLVLAVPATTTSRALSLALHISLVTKDSSRMSGTTTRVSRRVSATTTIRCSALLVRRLVRMPQHHQALARTPTLSQWSPMPTPPPLKIPASSVVN